MRLLYVHYTKGKFGDGVHSENFVRTAEPLVDEFVAYKPFFRKAPPADSAVGPEGEGKPGLWRRLRGCLAYYLYDFHYIARAWLAQLPAEYRLLREVKPDAIIMRYSEYVSLAGLARWFGIPLILEFNAPLSEMTSYDKEHKHFPRLLKWFEDRVLGQVSSIMCVTSAAKAMLEERGVAPERIFVNHNGVDSTRFDPGRADGASVRERYGLKDAFVVGYSGFFKPWHRLELLVEALAALPGDQDIRLLLIGDSHNRGALDEAIAAHGMGARVTVTGLLPHEEVPDYIAACDACIIPYHQDYCSPIKLFEYMAMKRPVIAVNTPGIAEIITDGENGLLTPAGDSAALADAILQLQGDADLQTQLAERACELVHAEYSWEMNARRLVERARALKESAAL